jgi:dTDP-4-amino-4,6-dideoxygalactose transaminase
MHVPFLDLKAQHLPIQEAISAAIREVIDTSSFAGGPMVAKFETEFAAYCGTEHAIGVGSGTEALWFSLLALGIGPGDEVITVPHTFVATAEAISACGAKPVFVDIEESTCTLNPRLIERAITSRTKAIIPVHIFGQPAAMKPIREVAEEHDLLVIEDACQAHGALYQGRRAGSMGVAGCFSFYPGKNLGAFGEAGAVTTNDPVLAQKIRVLRDHGQARKYDHSVLGWNGRMDGIQGAILSVKLKFLDQANQRRRELARLYDRLLAEVPGVITPHTLDDSCPVYHIYAIRIKKRDQVMQLMSSQGVGCSIHYPIPLHLQKVYQFLGYGIGDFPVAERCAAEFLSLPMYPELTEGQLRVVVKALQNSVREVDALCCVRDQ